MRASTQEAPLRPRPRAWCAASRLTPRALAALSRISWSAWASCETSSPPPPADAARYDAPPPLLAGRVEPPPGSSPPPPGCTWRVKDVIKIVNKTCSNDKVFTVIEQDAKGAPLLSGAAMAAGEPAPWLRR